MPTVHLAIFVPIDAAGVYRVEKIPAEQFGREVRTAFDARRLVPHVAIANTLDVICALSGRDIPNRSGRVDLQPGDVVLLARLDRPRPRDDEELSVIDFNYFRVKFTEE